MEIIIRNSSNQPIYEQIKTQIREAIFSETLKPGEQLPSIRHLAKSLRISVITTKRAYDDLEAEGYVYSVQGKGSFVAERNPDFVREEHLRQLEEHLREAAILVRRLGMTREEVSELWDIMEGGDEDE